MLYDPKWEVKADPFTLDSLIAWLEKQPADGVYDYTDPHDCLLCQYFRAVGIETRAVALDVRYPDQSDSGVRFPYALKNVSHGKERGGWTFGAALDRARAAKP